MEVVEWKKMVPSLPLLSCELSVSVRENPDRKKKKNLATYSYHLGQKHFWACKGIDGHLTIWSASLTPSLPFYLRACLFTLFVNVEILVLKQKLSSGY